MKNRIEALVADLQSDFASVGKGLLPKKGSYSKKNAKKSDLEIKLEKIQENINSIQNAINTEAKELEKSAFLSHKTEAKSSSNTSCLNIEDKQQLMASRARNASDFLNNYLTTQEFSQQLTSASSEDKLGLNLTKQELDSHLIKRKLQNLNKNKKESDADLIECLDKTQTNINSKINDKEIIFQSGNIRICLEVRIYYLCYVTF